MKSIVSPFNNKDCMTEIKEVLAKHGYESFLVAYADGVANNEQLWNAELFADPEALLEYVQLDIVTKLEEMIEEQDEEDLTAKT